MGEKRKKNKGEKIIAITFRTEDKFLEYNSWNSPVLHGNSLGVWGFFLTFILISQSLTFLLKLHSSFSAHIGPF